MIDDVLRARSHQRTQFGPELGRKAGEFDLYRRLCQGAEAKPAIGFGQGHAEIAVIDERLAHDRRDDACFLKCDFMGQQVAHDGARHVAKFLDIVWQFEIHGASPPS